MNILYIKHFNQHSHSIGRPSGPPIARNPQELSDKLAPDFPPGLPLNPALPVPCHCSPETDSRSSNSLRSSPSPGQLSPGGPNDLSMAKNPVPNESFEINKNTSSDNMNLDTQI